MAAVRAWVGPVDLVDGDRHRAARRAAAQQLGDETVPGADALLGVDDEQAAVGVGELALDPVLHALGERIPGALDPGRSTSTSCQSGPLATPRIARRVVCGLSETIATLAPTIALASVDLPTLGRPAKATKPDRVAAGGRVARIAPSHAIS